MEFPPTPISFTSPLYTHIHVMFSRSLRQTRVPQEGILPGKRRWKKEFTVYLSTGVEIKLKYQVSKSISVNVEVSVCSTAFRATDSCRIVPFTLPLTTVVVGISYKQKTMSLSLTVNISVCGLLLSSERHVTSVARNRSERQSTVFPKRILLIF